jgi:hypothetical protein
MRNRSLLILPLLAAPLAAQWSLPASTLTLRAAPRAAWTAVTSAGNNTTGTTFRCDNPGAANYDKLYVFGGCLNNNTATTVNDLWAFDAVAGTFTQVHDGAVSLAPHARGRAAIAWNFTTQRLVVFGGDNRATGPLPADTLLGDTWEYDPVTNTWTDVTPAAGNPTPRRWAGMSWDPITGGMLLFGGDTGNTTISGETWLFIGGTWVQMSPGTPPPARRFPGLVTRADFGDIVMLGGEDNTLTGPYGADVYRHLDVWRWDGGNWHLLSDFDWQNATGTFPASGNSCQPVYDEMRQRIVLQGGSGIAAGTAANTTYLFGLSLYSGSPSNYTSEFDCLTNRWTLYANPMTGTAPYNNNDPQIGRISRFFAGFVPATGKVYKLCGQNPVLSGSKPAYSVYEYQANPVATTTAIGPGCSGSAGPLTLTAAGDPWTGRTWNLTGTGFPAAALGAAVIGFGTQNLPLAGLHPAAGAGCNLLVTTDAQLLLLPTAGQATMPIALPAVPAIAGLPLNVQMIGVELGAQNQITLITSTNAIGGLVGAL